MELCRYIIFLVTFRIRGCMKVDAHVNYDEMAKWFVLGTGYHRSGYAVLKGTWVSPKIRILSL